MRLRRLAIDLSPLRDSRDYRLYFVGQLVSITGTQFRHIAIPFQVWQLTHSPLAVGGVGFVAAITLGSFALFGGVIADSWDRRRLIIATQIGLALVSVALAVGTLTGHANLPFLYAMTALGAVFAALDAPARSAMVPSIVGTEKIASAIALNQVMFQTAQVVGPAVGGIIIARFGVAMAYFVDVASFGFSTVTVAAMRVRGRPLNAAKASFNSLVEGLRYLRSQPILWSTMTLDFTAMFFGWPRSLMPFFAEEVFNGGPQVLGLLFAAPGVGALLGALTTGWLKHVRHQGRTVLWAVVGWGAAIAAFGFVGRNLMLGLVFLAIAGLSDVWSAVLRGTILQTIVPDELRGRLSSVNLIVVLTGPRMGELESGAVAQAFSPQLSVVSGGIACLACAGIIAAKVPKLWSWTNPHD